MTDRPSQASTHGNLAVAYQALGAHDRALQHYLQHLSIARELRDTPSQARALGKPNRDGGPDVWRELESDVNVSFQQTWATSTAGEGNMPRPCPTTSSTWPWLQACRTWKEKGRFAITSATLTTAWDSIGTLSGQNEADNGHIRLFLIQTAAKFVITSA